ncbi:MAG TPA: RNA methyltransferase [Candidatus Acidoferrales bacterium]
MTATADRRVLSRFPEPITSRDNRWLKRFRSALAGEPTGKLTGELSGIEGARLVETALRSGVEITALLVSESGAHHLARLQQWIPPAARLLRTSDGMFAHAAATEAPQGIAALVRPRAATFDDLVRGLPLVLVMAGVQDPGNVGALVRTAEAFGASGAATCSAGGMGTANPFGPKALRASAGAALRLPILRGVATPILLAQLRVAGVRVYAACPDASQAVAPWEADWRVPAALLVGNEGAGLPPELVRSADAVVRIPQSIPAGCKYSPHPSTAPDAAAATGPALDSLNAAVAGSILLYEAARQRGRGITAATGGS